ncbi:hypothetical protein JHK87_034818 [Glycine soja]|nr:hypothetical protein JHK87_034818 [Glycine soja]
MALHKSNENILEHLGDLLNNSLNDTSTLSTILSRGNNSPRDTQLQEAHTRTDLIYLKLENADARRDDEDGVLTFTLLLLLFLLLLVALFPSSLSEIRFSEIRNDDRSIVPFDQFGFTHKGRLELSQLEDGEIRCALQSDLVKSVYTFNSLNGKDSFSTLYKEETDADQYNLVFANCHSPQLKVTMDVKSAMYNLDGKSDVRDYLSAGRTILPRVFPLLACVFHPRSSLDQRPLQEALDRLPHPLLHACRGYLESPESLVRGRGQILHQAHRKRPRIRKKGSHRCHPLQVIANIAQVVIDENGPYGHDWATWKQVFLLVDVVCCCAVLFPIVWSIKNLREAARTDGKAAAVNLMKLTLFRHYYVVVICYIYFTSSLSPAGSFAYLDVANLMTPSLIGLGSCPYERCLAVFWV